MPADPLFQKDPAFQKVEDERASLAKEMAELMERMTVEQIQSHIQKAREILAVGVAADVDKALEEAREAYKGAKEEKAEADDDDFEEEKAEENRKRIFSAWPVKRQFML